MNDQVECRSELEYAQRPLAFIWKGKRWSVLDILTEHRTPAGKVFHVQTSEQEVFELSYTEILDQWTIRPYSWRENA